MRVSGRRAFPRFRTLGAWLGRLRISKQVAVNLTEPGLTVISDSPGVVDEEFSLALVYGRQTGGCQGARSCDEPAGAGRRPLSPAETRGPRRPERLGRSESVDAMSPGLLTGPSVIAVLGRDVVVRLLEISRSGCLLESSHAMPAGTIAALAIEIDGREVHGRGPRVAVTTPGGRGRAIPVGCGVSVAAAAAGTFAPQLRGNAHQAIRRGWRSAIVRRQGISGVL